MSIKMHIYSNFRIKKKYIREKILQYDINCTIGLYLDFAVSCCCHLNFLYALNIPEYL